MGIKMTSSLVGNKKSLALIFMLLGFSMISCAISEYSFKSDSSKFPEDSRVDRSFVTGQPCEAPCWYGLRLGESTLDDIRMTLLELPFVDASQIHEQPTGDFGPNEKLLVVRCVYSKELESCADLETSADGKLRRIILGVYYDLPLQSVIDQLGTPKYYLAYPSPNKDICILEIYWPEKNIVATVEESPRTRHCSNDKNEPIDLDLQVVSLVYIEINVRDQQNDENRPWPNSTR